MAGQVQLTVVASRPVVSGVAGEAVEFEVAVTNTGDLAAFNLRQLEDPQGVIRIGAKVLDAAGTTISEGRGDLRVGVLAGQATTATVRLLAPDSPGTYRLVLTPVAELVAWFDSDSVELELEVRDG